MSKVVFSDYYGTEVVSDFSRSGLIRIDMTNKGWPDRKHSSTGDALGYCISMTREQGTIHPALGQMLRQVEADE